jgi:hypothetical protein
MAKFRITHSNGWAWIASKSTKLTADKITEQAETWAIRMVGEDDVTREMVFDTEELQTLLLSFQMIKKSFVGD